MELLEALKPHRPSWRWLLLLIPLVAVLFGVYQVYFGYRVHASATPDQLEVQRTFVSNASGIVPPTPGDWVFGASQAQQVLAAIDGLPAASGDQRFCALGDGSVFHYIFRRGRTVVLQASADEGGCEELILSGRDIRQEDGNFILLMEHLLNLSSY
jgi:hypothetical protein